MRKGILLVAFMVTISTSALAACQIQGFGLGLGIPSYGDSGTVFASCLITDFTTLNSFALTSSSTPWIHNPISSYTYLSNASDKVGIQTQTPAATLDVNGSEIIRGSFTMAVASLFSATTSSASFASLTVAGLTVAGNPTASSGTYTGLLSTLPAYTFGWATDSKTLLFNTGDATQGTGGIIAR